MCDTVLSCARDHLLPLARDHLLPLLNMIRGVPKEIAEMKDELENILDFINKEDKMADSIKGINMKDQHEKEIKIKGIQTRIKQLIEASFHIEDVIDEYMICEEQPLGCAAGGANLVKTMILRLQIAYKIHNIKSQITEITNTSEKDHDGFQIQSSVQLQGSSSSTSLLLQNLQEAPFHMEESDVVGFDKPRDILIDLLVNGRTDLTIVSVVAMGGQGKTTLAKKVFDNNKVVNHFDFHVWITVSQSYDMERLLRDILKKSDNPPEGIDQMNRASLVDEVKKYLQDKRYVVVFDDVWDLLFWADIEFAMIDKKKGSRILITTRKMDVANVCRKSSFVEIHELKSLNDKQSLELFNKKAFHDLNGCCPENLVDISSKIVEKCYGLPLAIVVINGLLSCKDRSYTYDWYRFSKNMNTELNEDSNIKLILSLIYHDLPYNLKQCLLYFGLYPEECLVPSKKLTQQWIAEGFVKEDRAKTLEEVAEGYLTELIHRSLVQVHSFRFDGRSKYCYVHDLVLAMILEKCEDLSFCKHISVDKQSSLTGMVRRLSIAANSDNLLEGIENSQVRSLLVYKPKTLSKSFVRTIPTKYRQLKVLNLDDDQLLEVPKDVIDDYMICEEQQLPDPGCAAFAANYVKTMSLRLQIAYKIQNIKSRIDEIKDTGIERDRGFQIKSSSEQGASSSGVNSNAILLQNLRKAPFYMEEADVVGFEEPKKLLIDWLVKGRAERTVVSVVAMGGQGKTTLAKKVFDNPKVVQHFDYHVWITVSQQYNAEGLLRDMLHKLYKEKEKDPPESINQMDRDSLVNEVRNFLQLKRYVVVFDDVWNIFFWDEIDFAMIDNKNGSKIIITTRNMDVMIACKKSSFLEVHELKPLTKEKSLELFNKKAFHDLKGFCPENLVDISSKIVEKCSGLPLAIVVTGGLLSCKDRNTFEWDRFNENIMPELKEDSRIKKILALSYHDLPYNLKLCLLCFGLYPEDRVLISETLTLQWIAEGYVKEVRGKTLEEVAEGYLEELTRRCLTQGYIRINDEKRIEACHVHDLVHAMILEKCEDLSFCNNISDHRQSSLTGMVRRLSITDTNSDNLMKSIENSHVRSLLVLTSKILNDSFVSKIPTTFRRLKVLCLKDDGLLEVPKNLGSLSHLKYFVLWGGGGGGTGERILSLPKSIGMLENLETLNLSRTKFKAIPKEICKLKKLRHFRGIKMSLIQLKDDIGDMASLQTLGEVCLDEHENEDEIDERVVKLIQELGKLEQLRELVLLHVRGRYMSVISSSINKMQKMEKLRISTMRHEAVIDMDLNSPPPLLQLVVLNGKLKNFPGWISKLQNLAGLKVQLMYSKQTDDLMKLLKSFPNLLSLSVSGGAEEDGLESLHFEDGWFKNLKLLQVRNFHSLSYIDIDKGALGSLKELCIFSTPQLKMLPTGIQHLKKLEVLRISSVSDEFMQSIAPNEGKEHWIFKQVPSVKITTS